MKSCSITEGTTLTSCPHLGQALSKSLLLSEEDQGLTLGSPMLVQHSLSSMHIISSWYSTLKPDNWAQNYLWTQQFPWDQRSSDSFCNLDLGFFSLLNLLFMSSTTVPCAPVSPAPCPCPQSCHTVVGLTWDNGHLWSSMWTDSSYLFACVCKFL